MPFAGVPVLLLSASPSPFGGSRGLEQVRIPLAGLKSWVFEETFSLVKAFDNINEDGSLAEEHAAALKKTVEAFVKYSNEVDRSVSW